MLQPSPVATTSPRPAHRSLWALALLCSGFALARWSGDAAPGSILSFAAACALVACGLAARGWPCRILLSAAVITLGAAWFTLRIHESPRNTLASLLNTDPLAEPAIITLHALAADIPRKREAERGELDGPISAASWAFDVHADALSTPRGDVPVTGRVRVFVAGEKPDVRAGQRIAIIGAIEPVRNRGNPGEYGLRAWAAQEGAAGSMSVPGAELIRPLPAPQGSARVHAAWLTWRSALRLRAEAALGGDTAAPSESQSRARALLRSLLLGERDPELRDVQAAFQGLGVVHLVAISGFNLAVMAFIALFLLRLTGDRGWLEPALLALLVAAYMLVLPAETPIIRSGLMVLAFLLIEATGRRYDRLTTLGWIGCALLLWRPLDAWSLGFQLSMGVTAVLLWMGDRAADRLFGAQLRGLTPDRGRGPAVAARRLGRAALRAVKQLAAASLLSWAVAAPMVICQTGVLSPLAPLTTLIVLPLVTLVLWAGYVVLMLGALIPALGSWAAGALDVIASFLIDVVLALDALPGTSVHLPRVSLLWAAAATMGVLWLAARGRLRSRACWLAALLIAAWLAAEVWLGPRLAAGRNVALRIDTLAVGDGTCHVVRAGDEAILWDCGSLTPRIGERVVARAVRALGAGRVRTAIVTHANVDHYSGLPDVIAPLGIDVVLVSHALSREAETSPASGAARLLSLLQSRGVSVRVVAAGDRFELGRNGAQVELIWPPPEYSPRLVNDASLVARISVPTVSGDRAALLTGDIGTESIAHLLEGAASRASAASTLTGVSILELPHHGSVNDAALEFVRRVAPDVVLQSTGPHRARRAEWTTVRGDSRWWVTARDGAAWATIERDGEVLSGTLQTAPAK